MATWWRLGRWPRSSLKHKAGCPPPHFSQHSCGAQARPPPQSRCPCNRRARARWSAWPKNSGRRCAQGGSLGGLVAQQRQHWPAQQECAQTLEVGLSWPRSGAMRASRCQSSPSRSLPASPRLAIRPLLSPSEASVLVFSPFASTSTSAFASASASASASAAGATKLGAGRRSGGSRWFAASVLCSAPPSVPLCPIGLAGSSCWLRRPAQLEPRETDPTNESGCVRAPPSV